MEGVVSWADHIQTIHSWHIILRSTKLLGQPGKNLPTNEISADENDVCKMMGLIVHLVVWEHLCGIVKVPGRFPKFPMEFPGGQSQAKSKHPPDWELLKVQYLISDHWLQIRCASVLWNWIVELKQIDRDQFLSVTRFRSWTGSDQEFGSAIDFHNLEVRICELNFAQWAFALGIRTLINVWYIVRSIAGHPVYQFNSCVFLMHLFLNRN